jgi:hypothetical protein
LEDIHIGRLWIYFLYECFVFEMLAHKSLTWRKYCAKQVMVNRHFLSPAKGVKVDRSEIVSPIVSLHMLVDCGLFCINILTFKFGTRVFWIEKILWQKNVVNKNISAFGRVSKLVVVKWFLKTTHVGRL